MVFSTKVKIITNIISAVIFVGLIVTIIALGTANKRKTAEIKEHKATIEMQSGQIAELKEYTKRLAEINGVQVSVTFELNQKNVLSQVNTNAQAIAKEICQLTRQQVLDSLAVYTNTNYKE